MHAYTHACMHACITVAYIIHTYTHPPIHTHTHTHTHTQGERAAEQARQQQQQQITDLERALQEERAKPKGGSEEDMARLALLDEQIDQLKRALDAAQKDAAKATEQV